MSDDRLDDLGSERRSAAERFAELDERQPEEDLRPPAPRRPSSRYSWVVGIVFLVIIIGAAINTIPRGGEGVRGPQPGERLQHFAAPLATGDLDGDANVRQDADGDERAGALPACDVEGPDVVNSCELTRGPLVLTFIVTRAADCEPQLDRVERVRRRFPGVTFAGIVSGDDHDDVARLVRDHGWGFPVAVDRDGALVNLFGVGVCPTTTFVHAGGEVRESRLGNVDEEELARAVRALEREDRGR